MRGRDKFSSPHIGRTGLQDLKARQLEIGLEAVFARTQERYPLGFDRCASENCYKIIEILPRSRRPSGALIGSLGLSIGRRPSSASVAVLLQPSSVRSDLMAIGRERALEPRALHHAA